MITSLIALVALSRAYTAPTAVDLLPSDDVWVYPHASDPGKDPFLRMWGAGGDSVAATADDAADFSYSYLKFDLSKVPSDWKISSATLVLTQVPDPSYEEEDAKKTPIEVRPLQGTFDEKSWNYDLISKVSPTKGVKAVFGTGVAKSFASGKEVVFEVDLLKGPADFKGAVSKAIASSDKSLALGLTSAMDPSSLGSRASFKIYSKDSDKKEFRPLLRLKFE